MATAQHKQREGLPYRYKVQYWGANGIHNTYYFDFFEGARQRYLHLLLDQVLEDRYISLVRFERHDGERYVRVFSSHLYNPTLGERGE